MRKLNEIQIKNRAEKVRRAKEGKMEELWDYICSEIGFTKKGFQIQDAIKKFIKLKVEYLSGIIK